MSQMETAVWGIHVGKSENVDKLFFKNGLIAIGWPKLGDLSKLKADREDFKKKLVQGYPKSKTGAVPINAGQLFRFVHEMKENDIIVYPCKHDKQVHIGIITGPYKYEITLSDNYPNVRSVKWVKELPRTHFTQGALYELGSALSFFQIKNYADEFRAAMEGKINKTAHVKDETVAIVAEEIEATTRDFILKQLSQELKGHPLAEFVAHLLETMSYRTRLSEAGPDGGIDIIAHKDELGFEPPIIKVQVKSSDGSIGDPIVSALYGKVAAGEFGLLVTLGTFTSQAKNFAKSKSNLRLIDGDELVNLILLHYEQFDSRYKGLLPLKRVYVPQTLEETES